jgi:transcriptional regulator with GAF, ATPase, and Fis domain
MTAPIPDQLPREVEVLRQIANQLPATTDLPALLERITAAVVGAGGLSWASVQLYIPDRDCPVCRADPSIQADEVPRLHRLILSGGDARLAGVHRVPPGLYFSGKAAIDRRPLIVNDPIATARTWFGESPDGQRTARQRIEDTVGWLQANRLESGVYFPLLVQEELVGVLSVMAQRPIRPEEVPYLEIFACQAATAIRGAQLSQEVERLRAQLERENDYLQAAVVEEGGFDGIVGESPLIKAVMQQVSQVAPTDTTVLILGETGTGKEMIARAIHRQSARGTRPLIKMNGAAIAPGVVESELFGHERGAFTGAVQRRIGRFELADRGTLFLDEVGELGPDIQAKLLRVLQEGEFERVGGSETLVVDVRLIAATNRDLTQEMGAGRFRRDLFYRLNVFPLHLPPLRDRRDDIPRLAAHFVTRFGRRLGRSVSGLSSASVKRLVSYDWPGNIRELQNVIERACVLSPGPIVEVSDDHLSAGRPGAAPAGPAEGEPLLSFAEMEAAYYRRVLEARDWRIEGPDGAASVLGLNPATLRSRMRRLRIQRPAPAD